MTSLVIPLDNVAMVLSNDHIVGLDYPATEPSPNFPFEFDLTIGRSLDNGTDESSNFAIEFQIGVHYEYVVSHIHLYSPNDECLLVDSIIGVDLSLPVKYDLPMHMYANFGLNELSHIDSTKVTNTTEDFKVDDTHIQVNINRSIPLNLLHTITILLFLRYRTLSWIPHCLGIGLPPIAL